jgi:Arc/MetJ-type ribon-helix-helix transcriptional regulator
MKVSVSLPDEDVEFLDQYAQTKGYHSRSAVVHQAVRLLRASELGADYADAWAAWSDSGDAEAWDSVVGDGWAPADAAR